MDKCMENTHRIVARIEWFKPGAREPKRTQTQLKKELFVAAMLTNGNTDVLCDVYYRGTFHFTQEEWNEANARFMKIGRYDTFYIRGEEEFEEIFNGEATTPVVIVFVGSPNRYGITIKDVVHDRKRIGIYGTRTMDNLHLEAIDACKRENKSYVFYNTVERCLEFECDACIGIIPDVHSDLGVPNVNDQLGDLFGDLCRKLLILNVPENINVRETIQQAMLTYVINIEKRGEEEGIPLRIGIIPTTPSPNLYNNTLIKCRLFTHLLVHKFEVIRFLSEDMEIPSGGKEIGGE